MREVEQFVGRLPEAERRQLANAIGSGLHDARLAAQCLTDPGPQAQTIPPLLSYLTRAINELSTARELITRRLEQVERPPEDQASG